jgi:ribonuclease HII
MDQLVRAINEQRPEIELRLDSFHSRGQPKAIFTLINKHDIKKIERQIKQEFETKIKVLENEKKILNEINEKLINQPQIINATHLQIERLITMRDLNFSNNKNIVFAKDHATVKQTNMNHVTNNELLTEINNLKDEISKINIDQTDREAIDTQFENLENYANSNKKNSVLMKSTLEAIKNITIGALGGALGGAMTPGLVEAFNRLELMIK